MNLLHTLHVPPGDGLFPTAIALHGWGASAHDLLGLAPYVSRWQIVALALNDVVGSGVYLLPAAAAAPS